jgi:hypothetical protein
MQKSKITCPKCGSSEQTVKVSTLFLEGTENRVNVDAFAPPSGKRQITRPVHPDMIVIVFGIVSLLILFQIFQTQKLAFVPAAAIFMMAGLSYLVFRKKILEKYERNQDAIKLENQAIEKAVGEWMKLYFCAKDRIVFIPGEKKSVALEDIKTLIMK